MACEHAFAGGQSTMKAAFSILAVAALSASSIAYGASTWRFSPDSTRWSAVASQIEIFNSDGTNEMCAANWTFKTNSRGIIQITGLSAPACGVTFIGLPWKMIATTEGEGRAYNVSWTSPSGVCSQTLKWYVFESSASVHYATTEKGKCAFTGSFTLSPPLGTVNE